MWYAWSYFYFQNQELLYYVYIGMSSLLINMLCHCSAMIAPMQLCMQKLKCMRTKVTLISTETECRKYCTYKNNVIQAQWHFPIPCEAFVYYVLFLAWNECKTECKQNDQTSLNLIKTVKKEHKTTKLLWIFRFIWSLCIASIEIVFYVLIFPLSCYHYFSLRYYFFHISIGS